MRRRWYARSRSAPKPWGSSDLWVTNNTLDHAGCFDSLTLLTYAAAITSTIRVGVSVLVLPVYNPIHVAHQVATLDYLSGGRAVLGVGLGREQHYAEFQIPRERRVRRFLEEVELMKALWTQPKVTYRGQIFQLEDGVMGPKPVQKPHPPVWLGGGHPDALRRAAAVADGWMGAGGSTTAAFAKSVPLVRAALEITGRDPATFPISKRVFMSVHERPEVAQAEVHRWFSTVYHNPDLTTTGGVYGTPGAGAGATRRDGGHGRYPPAAQSRHPLHRAGRGAGRGGGAVTLVLSNSERR